MEKVVNCTCSQRKALDATLGRRGSVMTGFMVLTIVSFCGIVAMLCCFKGFSRELAAGRQRRRRIRVDKFSCVANGAAFTKIRRDEGARVASLLAMSEKKKSGRVKSRESRSGGDSLSAANVISLAILLASR